MATGAYGVTIHAAAHLVEEASKSDLVNAIILHQELEVFLAKDNLERCSTAMNKIRAKLNVKPFTKVIIFIFMVISRIFIFIYEKGNLRFLTESYLHKFF